ncbi:HEXXH motif-containing putative peptide modification protein [Pendulispora brunnea]|uniref:HEXXH motif-containing putative peptide modification protein n=1 Tax=Pendulispora brunnea TaxID=2905690 RepID=A0ABZ2K783_9BACT
MERYKFALDVFAARDPGFREFAAQIESLDEAAADRFFGDFLVRAELEMAIERLETGKDEAWGKSLFAVLDMALGAMSQHPESTISQHAMARRFVVGPRKQTWVWDLPDESTAIGDKLGEIVRTRFMPGSDCTFEPIRPTPKMVENLDRAIALAHHLVPEMTSSVFRHLHSIAIGHIRGPGGRRLTGSGGDPTPCMIFLDPDELENPWDTAGHILHEGMHVKLADLCRAGHIADEDRVELPWRGTTALSNCVFAFHAYVHLQVFRAAVERFGPAHHAEFGAPQDYKALAHPMSVVNTKTGPFARAEQRLDHYYQQLVGAWARRVTPYGHALVAWAWDALRPLNRRLASEPAHAGSSQMAPKGSMTEASSARCERRDDVLLRRSPRCSALFALEPRSHKILTLNLPAWLAFELCDGKTEREILAAYASSMDIPAESAWTELSPTLDALASSGMIMRDALQGSAT